MLDMAGMVVAAVVVFSTPLAETPTGGRRPNFTVHPPLSTMQIGKLSLLPVDIVGTGDEEEECGCEDGEDFLAFPDFLDGEEEDEPTTSFRVMAIVIVFPKPKPKPRSIVQNEEADLNDDESTAISNAEGLNDKVKSIYGNGTAGIIVWSGMRCGYEMRLAAAGCGGGN